MESTANCMLYSNNVHVFGWESIGFQATFYRKEAKQNDDYWDFTCL